MNDKEMLYIDTINDEEIESADNMNNETMILFRDMCALAPMTQIKPIAWIARYEHVLHDGIVHSMNKGECSGIVRDYSTRSLWRWERIDPRDMCAIEMRNCDNEEEKFAADVVPPCGEIVHSFYWDNVIKRDDWQKVIINALVNGESAGRFQDELNVTWRWCKA